MDDLTGRTFKSRKSTVFLRRRIGRGGMADVYEAFDQLRSCTMAVKVLLSQFANDERLLEMFSREAQTLKTLEHPHIVRLYDFWQAQGLAFLMMEYIDGGNLREKLQQRGRPFAPVELLPMLEAVQSALTFAHQLGLYHCDIKPANLMQHRNGEYKLTDFGVARAASGGQGGGTPAYMAPELFQGGQVGVASDVYALGVTLYELLSGRLPYNGQHPESQGGSLRQRMEWEHGHLWPPGLVGAGGAGEVSPGMEGVVFRAMAKRPGERYQSVGELVIAMRRQVLGQAENTILLRGGRPSEAGGGPVLSQGPSPQAGGLPGAGPREAGPREAGAREAGRQEAGRQEAGPDLSGGRGLGAGGERTPRVTGPCLIGRGGELTGVMIPLERGENRLGRNPGGRVQVSEPSVSRLAAIIVRPGLFGGPTVLIDSESKVRTRLNGKEVPKAVKVILKSGDLIQIGYHQVFEYREK